MGDDGWREKGSNRRYEIHHTDCDGAQGMVNGNDKVLCGVGSKEDERNSNAHVERLSVV